MTLSKKGNFFVANALDWDRVRLPNGKSKLICITTDGEWSILPIDYSNDEATWCVWHLCFRPAYKKPREYILFDWLADSENPAPDEYWKIQSLLGYEIPRHAEFWSEEAAVLATNTMAFGDATGSVEDILAEAGFVRDGEPYPDSYGGHSIEEQAYAKRVAGGVFKISLGNWANLTFDIDGRAENDEVWEIGDVCRNDGSEGDFPIYWPQAIEDNFQVLALRSVLAVMDRYVESGEFGDDLRTNLKPSAA